jgi:hypothetical protein
MVQDIDSKKIVLSVPSIPSKNVSKSILQSQALIQLKIDIAQIRCLQCAIEILS